MSPSSILTVLISALVSVILSTTATWLLGPRETIRQDVARRNLELRRRLRRILEQLKRQLRNEVLRRRALEAGGQVSFRSMIRDRDYEKLLWPAVRALDDLDLGRRMADELRAGLHDLRGSWRLEYLSICETDELENALDRFAIQPLEPRHVEEPQALLPSLFSRMGESEPVVAAVAKVQELIALLG
jgi:hypothetical protein